MKQIIVIGSYIEALIMETPRIPIKGETLMGKNFRQTWGGKGSNQAVQAARLGAEVSFVSMVGKDSFGDNFLQLMEDEKVNSSFVFRHPELPTASGFIVCSDDGHNIITIDIAALNGLTEKEMDQALEKAGKNSIALLQLEIPLKTAMYACEKAKEKGATVILNPAPAADLTDFDLTCVDFLTPNETEARVCLGLNPTDSQNDADIGMMLLDLGCQHVILTLGEQGCQLVNETQNVNIPAFKIENVVDSTGAGDSFNAAFAVGLAEGLPLEKAIRFGNAAAGLSVTKHDTIPSFHERGAVDKLLVD